MRELPETSSKIQDKKGTSLIARRICWWQNLIEALTVAIRKENEDAIDYLTGLVLVSTYDTHPVAAINAFQKIKDECPKEVRNDCIDLWEKFKKGELSIAKAKKQILDTHEVVRTAFDSMYADEQVQCGLTGANNEDERDERVLDQLIELLTYGPHCDASFEKEGVSCPPEIKQLRIAYVQLCDLAYARKLTKQLPYILILGKQTTSPYTAQELTPAFAKHVAGVVPPHLRDVRSSSDTQNMFLLGEEHSYSASSTGLAAELFSDVSERAELSGLLLDICVQHHTQYLLEEGIQANRVTVNELLTLAYTEKGAEAMQSFCKAKGVNFSSEQKLSPEPENAVNALVEIAVVCKKNGNQASPKYSTKNVSDSKEQESSTHDGATTPTLASSCG